LGPQCHCTLRSSQKTVCVLSLTPPSQGSDEFMGQAIVPLTDLYEFEATQDIWVELKPKGKEKVAGHLRMQYKYQTENYRKSLIEDRKACEAAEVELLRSLSTGIERPLPCCSSKSFATGVSHLCYS
jgi:hypothetical protein